MTALLENLGCNSECIVINNEVHIGYKINLRDDEAMVHAGKNYYYRCPSSVCDAVCCLYALFLTAIEYVNVTDFARNLATERLRQLGCEAMTDFFISDEHYSHCLEERDVLGGLCGFVFTPGVASREYPKEKKAERQ